MDKSPTYAEIWKHLSSVDISAHVESKNGLSYLSWAWAWGVLMEHYPQAEMNCPEVAYEANGTATVWVSVSIGDCRREMWLPVMDNRNKSVTNPTSREISDARMRCMVKSLALFGLGFSLYAGEDLPSASRDVSEQVRNAGAKASPKTRKAPAMSPENRDKIKHAADVRIKELGDESMTQKDVLVSVAKALGYSSPIEMKDAEFPKALELVQKWEPGS